MILLLNILVTTSDLPEVILTVNNLKDCTNYFLNYQIIRKDLTQSCFDRHYLMHLASVVFAQYCTITRFKLVF